MNILVFTSIYPIKGTKQGFTPIVKTFCEDWIKLGHNVLVISSSTKFPFFYYILPKNVNNLIENKVGFNIPNSMSKRKVEVIENGVKVLQIPIFKNFPGQIIKEETIYKNFLRLKKDIIDSFNPDVAIGHWVNPQVQYLHFIKKEYNIQTSLILHNKPTLKEVEQINTYMDFIDSFGFRSKTIKNGSNSVLNLVNKNQFLCLSGIKDIYKITEKEFEYKPIDKKNIRICFVGNLIARKFPEVIIKAVKDIKNVNFKIHFIGEGGMKNIIEKMPLYPNIEIFMHGRISREEVYKVMENTDFMVMISKEEAFGLVYLEAMLNRTIPIASKDEGFDGIIEDKLNGYLCKAGSVSDLRQKFFEIIGTDLDSLYNIQKECYQTAIRMTDEKMAVEYLKNINYEN